MSPITNRIITRGMGTSRGVTGRAGLVTQGYCGTPSFVTEVLSRPRDRHGRSGRRHRDELEVVILWAKLVEVNGRTPKRPVEGSVRLPINRSQISVLVERISMKATKLWNDIKVTAKRIK